MALRVKIALAFVLTALLVDVVSTGLYALMGIGLMSSVLSFVVAGVLSGAIGWIIGGNIAGSLGELNKVVKRFIKWDMSGTVPHTDRKDEIGDLARLMVAFQQDVPQEW